METVRTLTRDEVDTLLDWAASEGWNPGLDDAEVFHATDPDGFIGAFVDKVLVAGISVVTYGQHDGFLGLYLCHPDYRGKGHGWRVWQAGMQYLDNRSVGLDGVVDQQANYRRSGFKLSYRNIRYEGAPERGEQTAPQPYEIRPFRPSDFTAVLQIDATAHGIDRRSFMEYWLDEQTDSRRTVVLQHEGTVTGFGTIRRCRDQYKIGPLVISETNKSNTETAAATVRSMISTLACTVGAHRIVVDIPEPNEIALIVAQQLGLQPVFETARMYRGRAPAINEQCIFGVTTLELG